MVDNLPPRRSMDGVRSAPKKRLPEMRPDHELPAPDPMPLLEDSDQPQLQARFKPFAKKRNWKKLLIITSGVLVSILAVLFIIAFGWYQQQLSPLSDDTTKYIRVNIESGSTPDMIAKQLEDSKVIRNGFAFRVYTKLTATENKLQAGTYMLQPSLSTPTIVDHLAGGKQHTFAIRFLPGDTLKNNRQQLIDLDLFEIADIDAALQKTYDRPLFATKPAGLDLEGYIYGETYHFDATATPESILEQTFDEFEKVINENNLVEGYKKQGLTLFEGITLASIVQREVPNGDDQRAVARVFLNRMEEGMNLGSDVTYQYAADKMGVDRSPSLKSPYNTRIHTGLPPGPIAAPGASALQAVANPTNNDYLFFLSGDDDKTYFGRTEAEHQENIVRHCEKKCQIL